MKSVRNFLYTALFLVVATVPLQGKAQISLDSYYNIDWQLNMPVGNNFSNDISGWGMNFEGGYYVTQDIAVGAFISFHTNNEYFSRRTLKLSNTLSLNTDQQHQMFTLPFGALVRYRFIELRRIQQLLLHIHEKSGQMGLLYVARGWLQLVSLAQQHRLPHGNILQFCDKQMQYNVLFAE